MSEVIGIMEGAFFVSKGEILQWINETFQLNVSKIEQLGTGAVYCQILDSIYPGKVSMAKVNWKAHNEWEYINNLKILQQGFVKCGLNKHIEIEKLSKTKYQDNLEFAQWMKRYYDLNGGINKDYDAVQRRGNAAPDFGGDKPVLSRPKLDEKQPATRHSRAKEKLKSVEPNRNNSQNRNESAPRRFKSEKEDAKDIKMMRDYLLKMKDLLSGNNLSDAEKLARISDVVENGLKLQLFEGGKKEKLVKSDKKEHKEVIDKIKEDVAAEGKQDVL